MVDRVLSGFNGTVLCYGQSGSGKTHSLLGAAGGLGTSTRGIKKRKNSENNNNDENNEEGENYFGEWVMEEEVGMIPRILCYLLEQIETIENETNNNNSENENNGKRVSFTLGFSAVEIYNENLRDLLINYETKETKRKFKKESSVKRKNNNNNNEEGDFADEYGFEEETTSSSINNRKSNPRQNNNNNKPQTPVIPPLNTNNVGSSSGNRGKNSSRAGKNNNNNNNNEVPLRITNYSKKKGNAMIDNVSVYVDGLTEISVTDFAQVKRLLNEALLQRHVGATKLNINSSRSHTLFLVQLLQKIETYVDGTVETSKPNNKNNQNNNNKVTRVVTGVEYKKSLLTMVDLAGSERVSHTGAEGLRLKEAQNINLSLSQLSNVIRVMTNNGRKLAAAAATNAAAIPYTLEHVPYRDSKLTRLLQDSFGGNAITFLLCNVSPEKKNALETLSTLRFAQLAKQVKNKAVRNALKQKNNNLTGPVNIITQTVADPALQAQIDEQLTQIKLLKEELDTVNEKYSNAQAYALWLERQLDMFMRRCLHDNNNNINLNNNNLSYSTFEMAPVAEISENPRDAFVRHNSNVSSLSLSTALNTPTANKTEHGFTPLNPSLLMTNNNNNNNNTIRSPAVQALLTPSSSSYINKHNNNNQNDKAMEEEVLEEYLGVARQLRKEKEEHATTRRELTAAQEKVIELLMLLEEKEEKLKIVETSRRSLWDTYTHSVLTQQQQQNENENNEDEEIKNENNVEALMNSYMDYESSDEENNNNDNENNNEEEEEEEGTTEFQEDNNNDDGMKSRKLPSRLIFQKMITKIIILKIIIIRQRRCRGGVNVS
ncbi:Kinesin motor domain containing protein, putative [Angomonas deanei]|uniref:Kinesin motor domain containing protein, putative n=1 Tax=Angomonas deanei TaxID=59799 RepID=A0A7G2CRL8_9TRYP|nr:Kinesin motor domain containing protein, putative [Angomonas deanei]